LPAELLGRRDGGGGDPRVGRMSLMFDHIGFNVADFAKSKAFYLAAMKPPGVGLLA
jgi:hypothetical protein